MLKFISNKKAVMGLTLSHIGLFIATGIIVSAVFSFIYLNDYNKKAELDNLGNSFKVLVEAIDTKFFENQTKFFFQDLDYDYKVFVSTEYITVESNGNWNNILSSKTSFLKKSLIRHNEPLWKSADEFHNHLFVNFECYGNKSCPINLTKIDDVKEYIDSEKFHANYFYSKNPFKLNLNKPVLVEKAYVFYDINGNNYWEKNIDEKDELILIYQK